MVIPCSGTRRNRREVSKNLLRAGWGWRMWRWWETRRRASASIPRTSTQQTQPKICLKVEMRYRKTVTAKSTSLRKIYPSAEPGKMKQETSPGNEAMKKAAYQLCMRWNQLALSHFFQELRWKDNRKCINMRNFSFRACPKEGENFQDNYFSVWSILLCDAVWLEVADFVVNYPLCKQ